MPSKREKNINNCRIHRYKKIRQGDNKRLIYKCQNPGCTHFVSPELLEGRIAQCYNGCEGEFLITKAKAKLARPHCDKCKRTTNLTNTSKEDNLKKLEDLIEDLGL